MVTYLSTRTADDLENCFRLSRMPHIISHSMSFV